MYSFVNLIKNFKIGVKTYLLHHSPSFGLGAKLDIGGSTPGSVVLILLLNRKCAKKFPGLGSHIITGQSLKHLSERNFWFSAERLCMIYYANTRYNERGKGKNMLPFIADNVIIESKSEHLY